MNRKPSLGAKVHFVLNEGPNRGAHRAAVVVSPGDERSVNLQVFSDGTKSCGDYAPNVFYKKGAQHDPNGAVGTWHWPEEQA